MAQRLLSALSRAAISLASVPICNSFAASATAPAAVAVSALSSGALRSLRLRGAFTPALPAQIAGFSGSRGFSASAVCASKLKPEFVGKKLSPYTSYKERFRMTATGKIRFQRPGHRHKRFVKGPKRNRNLRQDKLLHDAYARTMKKLGFTG